MSFSCYWWSHIDDPYSADCYWLHLCHTGPAFRRYASIVLLLHNAWLLGWHRAFCLFSLTEYLIDACPSSFNPSLSHPARVGPLHTSLVNSPCFGPYCIISVQSQQSLELSAHWKVSFLVAISNKKKTSGTKLQPLFLEQAGTWRRALNALTKTVKNIESGLCTSLNF